MEKCFWPEGKYLRDKKKATHSFRFFVFGEYKKV